MISRNKATVSIKLAHVSKMRKDGTLSILLRITYCRKSKYFSLGYTATKNDFDKIYNGNVRGELKELKIKLQGTESKANNTIDYVGILKFSRVRFLTDGKLKITTSVRVGTIKRDTHFLSAHSYTGFLFIPIHEFISGFNIFIVV
jgi:hypothetical protein